MGSLFKKFGFGKIDAIIKKDKDLFMDKLYEHLKLREGYRLDVYKDSLGKPTVGVGHLVLPSDNLKVGDRITEARVKEFLKKDVAVALAHARAQMAEMGRNSDDFLLALTSVNFQLGGNWKKKFRTSYPNLVAGKYKKAIVGFKGSLWNRQTPVRVKDFIEAIEKEFGNK